MASSTTQRKVLFIVENLPSPFDRRVWQEATTLQKNGYLVSIICPTGKGYEKKYEYLDGIHIYRHSLPYEAEGKLGYLVEYSMALFWEFYLSFKVMFKHGFDVIHGCNPPDLIFIIGAFFRIFFGKKFIFDHHDICPELYEAKFGKGNFLYKTMIWCERLTFKTSKVSIATNESYKEIAVTRGGKSPDQVFVVRSGPKLDRLQIIDPVPALKKGRKHLVGYVGVMGIQEGIDYLLCSIKYIVDVTKRTDIHFGLVGGGTELEKMKKYSIELGISDYITFTGRVPDQEMLEMLNTADVCVNPDMYNEMNDKSTMNKIMEYMALAKPIVQFDLKEGRFSAQESSVYAKRNDYRDFADKILALLDDPEECTRMGEFGYNRVINELEWKYEEPKLLAAYDQAFESKKQTR